jgi:hypothetical protein
MKKKEILEISLALSGKCNRGCSHCFVNGNMNGPLFSMENAMLFSRELRRVSKMFPEIHYLLQLTGEGEILLNPNTVDILDMVMGLNENVTCNVVTSGANKNSCEESELLIKLASRPYANRLSFFVSFNEFEKHFSKRLIYTLKLLFESGIEKVTVKACLPNYYQDVIKKFFNLIINYFSKWSKKKSPLLPAEDFFFPVMEEFYLLAGVSQSCIINDKKSNKRNVVKSARKSYVDTRFLGKKDLLIKRDLLLTGFHQAFKFETEHGFRQIAFSPHFLAWMGRARSLDEKNNVVYDQNFCDNLTSRLNGGSFIHLGADGYYYPSGICPKSEYLRVGHVSEDFRVVLGRQNRIKKILTRGIISDLRMDASGNLCEICIETAKEFKLAI